MENDIKVTKINPPVLARFARKVLYLLGVRGGMDYGEWEGGVEGVSIEFLDKAFLDKYGHLKLCILG